jgi:hypothetical protein
MTKTVEAVDFSNEAFMVRFGDTQFLVPHGTYPLSTYLAERELRWNTDGTLGEVVEMITGPNPVTRERFTITWRAYGKALSKVCKARVTVQHNGSLVSFPMGKSLWRKLCRTAFGVVWSPDPQGETEHVAFVIQGAEEGFARRKSVRERLDAAKLNREALSPV